MKIPLNISPKIIPSIASLYNDTNRIFMEYIDNSIDDAEKYFDSNLKSYKKQINIEIKVEGNNYKNCVVKIIDNCSGIHSFNKLIQSIGDSEKKGDFTKNGQFGYGIYSFMACCRQIRIRSKLENNSCYNLIINRDQFNTSKQEDVTFSDPMVKKLNISVGTEIQLFDFDKDKFKLIDINNLKEEIEKHFELILNRKNLNVTITDNKGQKIDCKPFDYNSLDGEEFKIEINEVKTTTGKKYKSYHTIPCKPPIKVYLKFLKDKTIERYPTLIIKGRRISEIRDLRSFKSTHKTDIWGHPSLTGYIDLGVFLNPTIARNDFKNTKESKAVFEKINELEDLILDEMKKINRQNDKRHYKKLEDVLNGALSKLAKLDTMNYRTDYLTGGNINLEEGGEGKAIDGKGGKDYGNGESLDNGESIGENSDLESGKGLKGDDGIHPGNEDGKNSPQNIQSQNPFDNSNFKGIERKKSGFNIRIVDGLIYREEDNKPLRSEFMANEIRIFKDHEDFISRVTFANNGESKISQRLITYLAGEITIHYKDIYYSKTGQPEYNKNMFISVVDFIYQFEYMLKDMVNKNLADIE